MGRNAEGRTPVINNWKLNVCGVVNLNREKPAFLSDDIVEAEAQAARTPAPLACPDAQLLDDGRCPPSAIDRRSFCQESVRRIVGIGMS